MVRRSPRARGLHWLFFALLLVPILGVFPYVRAVNNPNELVRVFTSVAIVEDGTFAIDGQVARWGWVNDMARVRSKDDGELHYYMVKGPGVVYASLPGYALFSKVVAPLIGRSYPAANAPAEERLWWLRASTWALRLTTSQIPCFLFLLWFERYLRTFSPDPLLRYIAVAACGIGTNYLAYIHMFASHSQYASLAFLAFAFIEREKRLSRGDPKKRRWTYALIAGFCTSACVAFEYQSLFLTIVVSAFAVTVFWRPTRLLAFAVGGLVNVPLVMYFHHKAYGNPFTPGHQMLETATFAEEHKQGLWGILWPSWDHVVALATHPGFGFFGMSPFMWLGLLAVPLMLLSPLGPPSLRRSLRAGTVAWSLACGAIIAVNAGFVEWRAGWTVGPRYLVVWAPFFAFGACCAMERLAGASAGRRAIVRGVGGGLLLASVVSIGTVGIVYDTLPETIPRPFAQFALPMAWTGHVPHHVGEWFGWTSITFWYVVCAALLLVPFVASLWNVAPNGAPNVARSRGRWTLQLVRVVMFAAAFAAGMVPALTEPEDGSMRFVLHGSTRPIVAGWEPRGRDRITLLREDAERYGPRRPCLWYHLADLGRVMGNEGQARADEARAAGTPRERCRRRL